MLDTLPTIINNYRFIKPIGQGTFSVVYQVESIKYNQIFAAKVSITDSTVVSENGTIVDSEFNALQALDHPHIIRVFDKFFVNSFFVIILEYFPGGTIQDLLSAGTIFTVSRLQDLAFGILDGLALCHEKALAHRDIKPSNIFVDGYGRWKLADFNLCSILKSQKNLVKNPTGSLPYVSPEILTGNAYDPFKADIWALGVTFYQMTTGKLPWTDDEVLTGMRGPLIFPALYNVELMGIIQSMLNEKAEERPTVSELLKLPFFQEGRKVQKAFIHPQMLGLTKSTTYFSQQQQQAAEYLGTPSSIRMSAKFILQKRGTRPRRSSLTSRRMFKELD